MTREDELTRAVEDLIGVMHLQAEELRRLITHAERQTTRLTYPDQMPLVLSELSELHNRVKGLSAEKTAAK